VHVCSRAASQPAVDNHVLLFFLNSRDEDDDDEDDDEEDDDDDDDDGGAAMDEEDAPEEQTYLPGDELPENMQMTFDPSAYLTLQEWTTEWPCLSCDVLPDALGANRQTVGDVMRYGVVC
jgi:hypothetical protein